MKSVYSAVRTGSLNKADCASSLKGKIAKRIITPGVSQQFYLFSFVYLRIVFPFVGGIYCTNTVPCVCHTLTVFMVHFTVLCF